MFLKQQSLRRNDCDQQIEQNLNFDFLLMDETGNAFEPQACKSSVTGASLLICANSSPINSRPMASVIQVFTLPPFQQPYAAPLAVQHWIWFTQPPPEFCLEC